MMEEDLSMPVEPESQAESPIEYLENAVGSMFGPAGRFIVKKQVEMHLKGRAITDDDIPVIIDNICSVIGPLLGANLTKEFRTSSRRHFGLPI